MAVRTVPGGAKGFQAYPDALIAVGAGIPVPAGKKWVMQGYCVDVTCTATVGNRILGARLINANNAIMWMGTSSTAVTAGQVGGYDMSFGAVGTPSTTVRRNIANTANTNVQVREFCPITTLYPGDAFKIDDYADIDIADAITFRYWYTEYDL